MNLLWRVDVMCRWFDVQTTQMSIFILFESVKFLFDSAFSLWVSLMRFYLFILTIT